VLYFTAPPDESGTTAKLIDDYNHKNKGRYRIVFREGNADTGQRLDKLRTQFQAGGEDLDVILGDVIWTAELAASGWVSDMADRFPESDRQKFLPGSVDAITSTASLTRCRGSRIPASSTTARTCSKRAATTLLPRPGTS
jgi:multiple sugar transport system substrate-binding protein